MSITLGNIIDDIREIASSGSNPNEFKISDEQIAYWVHQVRATLIGQSLAKKDDINDTWLQTISCLELEDVDAAECCLAESDCYILRTIKKLPQTIDTWKNNWIVSVTTADGEPISKSSRFANRYQKYSKYTGKDRYYYLKDDYIYVINDNMLKYVNVTALFQDPSELSNYVACDDEACFSYDSTYPVSANMASQITDIIIKTKVTAFMAFPSDNINDASNDIEQKPRTK